MFKNAAIILLVTVLLYAGVDAVFGIVVGEQPHSGYLERRVSPAYVHEPYFSDDFLVESFSQPGGWITPAGTRLVFPAEFHGDYINVDVLVPTGNTYRRTVNTVPLDAADVVVLMLGGSTMYNSSVPDGYTIASQLQAMLNAGGKRRFHVVNAGVTSVNTTQERERLADELAKGLKPDVIVSLNGVNDVIQGVYFNNPDGVMFSNARRTGAREVRHQRTALLVVRAKQLLPRNIYLYLRSRSPRKKLPHMVSGDLDGVVARTVNVYRENIRAENHMARDRGAVFISVLQPHVYAGTHASYHPADREDVRTALALAQFKTPLLDTAYERTYPALRQAVTDLVREGIRAVDGSTLFDAANTPIFLDFCHVNAVGQRMLAEQVADLIRGALMRAG
ncbi:MAG: SGNH/GDSL hydrolase family protein [Leptospirillia bacterium]